MFLSFLSRQKLFLAAVFGLAVFFRFFRLDTLPPGLQFDQAFYVFDAIRLLQGEFHIFFAAPGGTEPLYVYLATVGVALFGDSALGLKLTSALIGVLTIPLLYGFTRTLFSPAPGSTGGADDNKRAERIAGLAALLAAVSLWHIFFSRYGERVTLLVLLAILLFWFLWRALDTSNVAARDYALTGLFLALALYTYPGARVLPFAVLGLAAYAAWNDRRHWQVYLRGVAVLVAVTGILCVPLALYFVEHPDQFLSHSAEVSIFVPHAGVQAGVGEMLVSNVLRLLGMFFVSGDTGTLRNVPGRPVFDPLTGALFLAGVVVAAFALFSRRSEPVDRRRALLLATWIAVVMAISLFTDDAPNFVRTLPAMPAIMILPAWGASAVWERLRLSQLRPVAVAGLVIVVAFSTWLSFRDYFVAFANDPMTYYTFDTDKVETANWINQNATAQRLYLAPLWYQNGTISLLTRNSPLKSFESRDTIVLPGRAAGKDALFAFPFEQEKKVQTMATRLGTLGSIERLTGSNGGGLLLIYRVPAGNLPDPENPLAALARGGDFVRPQQTAGATFADGLQLLGYTLSPEGPGGRNLTVTLFLRALQPLTADYTFSVKVRDGKERAWGQEDKWPGDNSYATSQWSAGDVVIEKFYPGLNACAPAGEYRVTVEAYDPKSMQVLGQPIALGGFQAGPSEGNRLGDLDPEHTINTSIAERVTLIGYTVPDAVRVGEEFSLALFWHGSGSASTENVTVRVGDVQLAASTIRLPGEAQGLCSLYDFRLPQGMPAGPAGVWVNDHKIGEVRITP